MNNINNIDNLALRHPPNNAQSLFYLGGKINIRPLVEQILDHVRVILLRCHVEWGETILKQINQMAGSERTETEIKNYDQAVHLAKKKLSKKMQNCVNDLYKI